MVIIEFIEKTISSETIFQGNILNLRVDQVKLPNNRQSTREVVEHTGGVTMLPVIDDNKLVMVKQFRQPAAEVLFRITGR